MPQLEQGLVGDVSGRAKVAAAALAPYLERGFDIVSLTSSCTLMLKQEWPSLLPNDAGVSAVAGRTFEATEFLVKLSKEGALMGGVVPPNMDAVVTLHNACHARAQNVGFKARELLSLVPGLRVSVANRCSGHGGTWGFQKAHYDSAHRVGAPVVRAAVASATKATTDSIPHFVVSECPLAADHLLDGVRREQPSGSSERRSPVEIVAQAFHLHQ